MFAAPPASNSFCRNQREQQRFDAMQPTIEPTGTKDAPHIALFVQKSRAQGVIVTKEQGDGHNLGIGDMTLGITAMPQTRHQIGPETIHCYHMGVHERDFLEQWMRCHNSSTLSWLPR